MSINYMDLYFQKVIIPSDQNFQELLQELAATFLFLAAKVNENKILAFSSSIISREKLIDLEA